MLEALGYVDVAKRGKHKNQLYEYLKDVQNEYYTGIAIRFRNTVKLIDQASSFVVQIEDYRHHLKKRPNLNQVTWKVSSQRIEWKKYSGRQIKKCAHTGQTFAIKEQLTQINTYLSQH